MTGGYKSHEKNKKQAKDNNIYDSKYLMLKGLAIAHINEELKSWLSKTEPVTIFPNNVPIEVYNPLTSIRLGMLHLLNEDPHSLQVKFDFSYDTPGEMFRRFISLLNFMSGFWRSRECIPVPGSFVPTKRNKRI